jgi:hypothetical protein
VLLDKRGILSESQQLTEALAEKLNNELLKTEDLKLKLGEKSTIQRTFYGSNCDLKFFQTWIFRFDNTDGNKVLTMVWDSPNKKFRIDSVSMNNGFRIWALKK